MALTDGSNVMLAPTAATTIASHGYEILTVGVGIWFVNIAYSLMFGAKAEGNPWGEGATTLEWTLSSPPPYHQFETLPVIDDKGHH